MASDGLTNREIGDRLFLSPRTVSSHLYRSLTKLGISGRNQLPDVIAPASTPATALDSAGGESSVQAAESRTDPRQVTPGTRAC